MKKMLAILFSAMMAFSLAACSSGASSSGADSSPASPTPSPEQVSASSEPVESAETPVSADSAAEAEPTEAGGTLVAYFSWSGNTRQVAEIIAQETGADLFEIDTVTPYTDDYNTLLDVAQEEQSQDARPELNAQVENWDSYDTIFVGYPNWWSDAPMAVYTFLESYDFTGKTVIPFNTSASGGFGRSLTGLEESAAGATILEGLALTEGELGDAQNHVTTWLDSLGLNG